ncbi:MAG: SDR family oxidoreductase [Candidatus Kapaibacteriales bacterium]
MSEYSNYNALVCGASEGIGYHTAKELAEMGFSVTVLSRTESKLVSLTRELKKIDENAEHDYLATNLDGSEKLDSAIEELSKKRDYSVIINNNAGPKAGPLAEANTSELIDGFNSHIISAHILLRHLLPGMKRSGYGRIVNVISTSVKAPIAGLGVSNTIRGAMGNWAKTLATELGPFGITVNNVLPGFTATGRLESLIKGKSLKQDATIAEIENQMKSTIPLRRFAEPEETAAAIGFLVSKSAAYINGINIPVDGGRLQSL